MSNVRRQVRTAQNRLNTNILLEQGARALAIGAAAWSAAWAVERAFGLGMPLGISLAAAAGIALLLTVGLMVANRVSELAAALTVDRAAGLKERCSTALVIGRSDDPFARAACADAESAAGRVHVPSHVPLKAPPSLPWSVATLAVAGLLYAFMPQLNLLASESKSPESIEAKAALQVEKKQVSTAYEQQMEQVRKMAEQNASLKDLNEVIEPLKMADVLDAKPEDVRRDVLKSVDKVSDKLEQKLSEEQMRGVEELKRRLAKLEPKNGDDPVSRLSEAMAQGSMKEAEQSISEMRKEIEKAAENAKDPEAQKKLEEMAKKLADLSKELEKQAGDDSRMKKELENKAGLSAEEAQKLMDKISKMDPEQMKQELKKALGDKGLNPQQMQDLAKKLQQNAEAKKQMQKMAEAMKKASKSCQNACDKQGENSQQDGQAASGALAEAQGMMSESEMSEQMMDELEAQIQELKDFRDGVCKGGGQCEGENPGGNNPDSEKIGNQGPNAGLGYGSRIGKQTGAHGYKKDRLESRGKGGQIIGRMLIDGPQLKGEATAEARDAVNSAVRDATNAIENERIPRQYHNVTKKYFEELAGLGQRPPARPAEPKPAEKPASDE